MTQPATPGQLRFFLLDQQEDRATLVKHITVDGPVEPDRLAAAVRAVARAQPALRTSLQLEPSGLRQRVHPASAVELEIRHTDCAGEAAVLKQLSGLAGARFDHGDGPLCRVKILVGPERTHCLFGVHTRSSTTTRQGSCSVTSSRPMSTARTPSSSQPP